MGVKTKWLLYSSTLMRSASPSCSGTGWVCFMLSLDLVTVGRKIYLKTHGPVISAALVIYFHPHLPSLCLFLSAEEACKQKTTKFVSLLWSESPHPLLNFFPRAQRACSVPLLSFVPRSALQICLHGPQFQTVLQFLASPFFLLLFPWRQ